MGFWSRLISLLSLAVIIGTGYFLFIEPGQLKEILFPPVPCTKPIRYSLGSIDPKFNLSTSTIMERLGIATRLWSEAAGKELFAYDPKGALKINFIYDERQAATDKLNELGYKISTDRASYDALKQKHAELKITLETKKIAIDTATRAFNTRSDAYEKEVAQWNAQGGATPEVYAKLNNEKRALQQESDRIKSLVDEHNASTAEINSMVSVINRIADSLNIKADQANEVTEGIEKEFEEGEYRVDQNGKRINIYEFDSMERLTRLLAHEFGHALDLDHVDDKNAIMYYLNNSKSISLSETDISLINAVCNTQ